MSERKSCCVYGCQKTKESNPECTFNPLPTDTARQHEWLKVIGRSAQYYIQAHINQESFYVCSSHFEDEDLKSTSILLPNALPTRHLPETSTIDPSSGTQTAESLFNRGNVTPVPTAGRPDNKNDEQPHNNVPLALQDELTRNIHRLMKELTIVDKDRNSKDFLFYALNLYLLNPPTYCFIRDALNLPKEKVFRKIKLKLSSKLDSRVLELLSSKLKSFPDKAKYCTVCIETVSVKNNVYYDISNDELVGLQDIDGIKNDEVAGMVYVVMLRSILVRWDQPVTYCCLAGMKNVAQLESWIDGIIASLLDIGFKVMALVTSQGSGLKKYGTEIKGVSPEQYYFTVNNNKIYYIFDFAELLNCLRNNLGSKDLNYNDKRISWQYIESLFRLENKKTHKLIPKILSGHVTLSNITKMTLVKYAAEIFSNTVSTAIHAYVDTKEMPEEARHTADFILFLNNLFDVLKSTTYKNDTYKCALGSNESQIELLQEASNVFSTAIWKSAEYKDTRTRGGYEKPPPYPRTVFPSVQVTLNSVTSIAQDLNNLGYKRLLTERLSLGALEKFINILRPTTSRNIVANKPTTINFCKNFPIQFLKYTLTKSPLSNRPNAFQKYFEDASGLDSNNMNDISGSSLVLLGRGETDYRIQLPKDYPTIYVASYIFYKCHQAHRCDMLDYYASTLPDLAKTKVYDAYNRKASFYGKLKLLNYQFIQYIEQLEIAFTQVFNKGWACPEHPGSQAFSNLRAIPFTDAPCKCFPKIYAVKLLIRLRIYTTIKAYNRRRQDVNISEFLSNLNSRLELIK